jgi:alkylation response protein AidB-like acyl-CoA dehydrogenase
MLFHLLHGAVAIARLKALHESPARRQHPWISCLSDRPDEVLHHIEQRFMEPDFAFDVSAIRTAAIKTRGEQAMWIADEGVQMLGGHGYLRDNPVEMWYRDTRTVSVLEGAVGV